jgi:cysteine-rich repeat protein/predicted outer membrane repeat protein
VVETGRLSPFAEVTCRQPADCPSGTVCIAELARCAPANGGCVERDDQGYHVVTDGNRCTLSTDAEGICRRGFCIAPVCGDGIVTPPEECDAGPANSDQVDAGCRSDCRPRRCGDGVRDSDELCDDGNDSAGDGCDTCVPSGCGNGLRDPNEACDDGDLENGDGCDSNCTPTGCGNGVVTGVEECDDGPLSSDLLPDACRTDCRPSRCGDGVTDSGEECDDGAANSDTRPNACRATGCLAPTCGDGVTDDASGEACDDGDDDGQNNCTNACQYARCGDGVLWNHGSGVESCDDGNSVTDDCVYGMTTCAVCDASCQPAAGTPVFCGDGRVDAPHGESCDDGSLRAGDGCDGACHVEPLFACAGEPSACARRIFVDELATGTPDGTSWATAYPDLQAALADAARDGPVEVWVAAGTYWPDRGPDVTPGDRGATFVLGSDVALYGGFAGNETARDQRDWSAHASILSGDLAGNDGPDPATHAENSRTVVTVGLQAQHVRLDGFVIHGGENSDYEGGGLRNLSSAVTTIARCTFADNAAGRSGGAIFNDGELHVDACRFENNWAEDSQGAFGGGAVANRGYLVASRCAFVDNATAGDGGAVHDAGFAVVTSSLLVGNSAAGNGGAVASTEIARTSVTNSVVVGNDAGMGGVALSMGSAILTLVNCTLAHNTASSHRVLTLPSTGRAQLVNVVSFGHGVSAIAPAAEVRYSCIEDGYFGSYPGNLPACAPVFVDADGVDDVAGTADDDLRLTAASPCIDAGDNLALPADAADLDEDGDLHELIPVDLDGQLRRVDHPAVDTGNGTAPIVDMGAHERPGG